MSPHVIGLCGPEGAGKSTTAKILVEQYGAEIIPFAEPLKRMLLALGIPRRHLYGTTAEKEEPLAMLGGKSGRDVMKTLGTEWGRNMVYRDLWSDRWKAMVNASRAPIVISDDLRFPNEEHVARELGASIICVVRPDTVKPTGPVHESMEYWKINADFQIVNPGSLPELSALIANGWEQLTKIRLLLAS
jgi:hypothetical protein